MKKNKDFFQKELFIRIKIKISSYQKKNFQINFKAIKKKLIKNH